MPQSSATACSPAWRIAAYGLTNRERDITQRLLAGLARKTIASELHISAHTVNDHVKAVFDKTGVSSAGQLRAQLFRQGTQGAASWIAPFTERSSLAAERSHCGTP